MLFPPVIEHGNEYQYQTEVVYHGDWGGQQSQHRIRKSLKLYVVLQRNALDQGQTIVGQPKSVKCLLCKVGPDQPNGAASTWGRIGLGGGGGGTASFLRKSLKVIKLYIVLQRNALDQGLTIVGQPNSVKCLV